MGPMGGATGPVGSGHGLRSNGSGLTRAGYFITLAYAVGMKRGERRCMRIRGSGAGMETEFLSWDGNQISVFIIFIKSNSSMLYLWNIFFIYY
jgi:hypothetical protein